MRETKNSDIKGPPKTGSFPETLKNQPSIINFP